jgi:hypothetical protein
MMNDLYDKSIHELVALADRALYSGDTNSALRMVHDCVEKIITQPVCTALVYASNDLDQLCRRIGRKNLAQSNLPHHIEFKEKKERQRIVYVVTKLQKSGGHSRLVWDFIKAQPDKDHIILATGIAGPSNLEGKLGESGSYGNIRFLSAPRGNFQSRLTWLQNNLMDVEPDHVYLFNHHQDSVAVSSIVPELGLKASFCHHGDHHLCLGVYLDNVVHLDHHPMGYHNCRDELGINNAYLPLTFEDRGLPSRTRDYEIKIGINTATVAGSNKIERPYFINYHDLVPQILKSTNGHHIHIGKLTPWTLRKIKSGLNDAEIELDRFIYIEYTPNVWKTLQEQEVDVYIASFPYGSGLSLIEAMGAGIPVILHRHLWSRMLSALELAYPEAFCWSAPKELLDYLLSADRINLKKEGDFARKHYEKNHMPHLLEDFLNSPELIIYKPLPMKPKSMLHHDEWAIALLLQMRPYNLFYNAIYRIFRRLRGFLS